MCSTSRGFGHHEYDTVFVPDLSIGNQFYANLLLFLQITRKTALFFMFGMTCYYVKLYNKVGKIHA
jgi:hypothetical protein